MKTLLAPALLAIAALALGTTLVLTCAEPPSVPTGFNSIAMNQHLGLSPLAPLGLDQQPTPRLFYPGVHQTNAQSFEILPTGRSAAPSQPTPLDLDKQSVSQLLQPGVYQTYPWTILLVVPGAGMNTRYFAVKPDTNSPMPIIIPHVEVVPKW